MSALELVRRHVVRHLVGYIALFVALGGTSYAAAQIGSSQIANDGVKSVDIANGTIASRDIANGTIRGVDVAKGTLHAANFAGGALPAGPKGAQGVAGPAGVRGPSFADGKQVENVNGIACNTPVSVGTLPVTVSTASRIWVHAHGTLIDNNAGSTEYSLFAELRDATDAQALARIPPAVDDNSANTGADDDIMPLSTDGVLLSTGAGAAAFVAQPGTYQLHLMVLAAGTCTTPLPNFGDNQGAGLDYLLLGTTP